MLASVLRQPLSRFITSSDSIELVRTLDIMQMIFSKTQEQIENKRRFQAKSFTCQISFSCLKHSYWNPMADVNSMTSQNITLEGSKGCITTLDID